MVGIKVTNQGNLVAHRRKLSAAPPRSVDTEALVDTGATRLYLKPSIIRELGLEKVAEVISHTPNGPKQRSLYEPVRLEIEGRYGNFDVVAVAPEFSLVPIHWCLNPCLGERSKNWRRDNPADERAADHPGPDRL